MKISSHVPDKVLLTENDERILMNAINLLQRMEDTIKINHKPTERTTSPGCSLTFDRIEETKSYLCFKNSDTKNSLKIETVIAMLKKLITTYTILETEIGENDYVLIKDNGRCYPTYIEWMQKNFEDEEKQMKMDIGFVPKEGLIGRVIKIAPHTLIGDKNIYCVDVGGRYYLMGEDGISKDLDMKTMFLER